MIDEVMVLRRQVHRLEEQLEITRRLANFAEPGPERSRTWRFIERESAHFSLSALCRACRVSRSAYYAWAKKGEGPTEADLEEAALANEIFDIWKSSRRRYGVPRITAALLKKGVL